MVTDTISPPVEPVKKICTFIGRAEKTTESKTYELLYNTETLTKFIMTLLIMKIHIKKILIIIITGDITYN
jgi:hypothetical protein